MINSIPKIDLNSDNTFGKVSQRTNPSDYWLEEKKSQPQSEFGQIKDSIKILSPDEARKTKNQKIIGISIASATLLTAGTLLLLLKGGPKGLSQNFRKLRNHLDTKINMAKLNGEGFVSKTNKIYVVTRKQLDRFLQKGDAVNNFTTIKDTIFERIMGCNKYTRKLHGSITKFFEKLGRQSVVNSYHNSRNSLSYAINLANDSIPNMSQNSSVLKRINELNTEIQTLSDKNFGKRALRSRYYLFRKATEEMKTAFEKLKDFWTTDVFKEFMADSKIVKQRESIAKGVNANRKELSYSLAHMNRDSEGIIMKMVEVVDIKDTDKITALRNLRTEIKQFAKNSENLSDVGLKNKILADMDKFSQDVIKSLSEKTIDEKSATQLLTEMGNLKNLFGNYKRGKLEELLDIYRQTLSPKEFKQVEKAYRDWIKSLDKSIKIETEDFVNKLRDLTMGSAPTDILSLLGGLGVLGYNLGKADDNNQRVSISLKYGIPALSLIGVSLYCNAKLFAGTKGLMVGTLASAILNRIGSFADDSLKNYQAKKVENPPKTV
jgi:hypothetical protein